MTVTEMLDKERAEFTRLERLRDQQLQNLEHTMYHLRVTKRNIRLLVKRLKEGK